MRSQRGEQQAVVLSAELSQQLRELSRAQGVTLFMTLLAGWQLLLSRYARQEQVVVGTPIAGRRQLQTEELIGFFVNTLALRTELTGDPSIEELLRRVREVVLEAYAHQDVPFEKLVEELQPERSLSHTPLFQVMFVLQNLRREQLAVSGLELEMIGGGETAQAKFALTLGLEESESGIVGTLGYQRELFTAETVGRLAGHYQRVLAEMVRAPQQRVSELRLLSGAEEAELVIENNRTERDYRQEVCIHELFAEQVQRRPDAVAVVYEAEQLSYGALNERANQVAHYLRSLGVGPGSLVGILMARSLEMVVGLLGVLKAGAAYVPLDPDYPRERLSLMLRDSGISVLLTQERLLTLIDHGEAGVVCLDRQWEVIAQESVENPISRASVENSAYVIYTSGSTGTPKGVVVTHRNIANYAQFICEKLGLHELPSGAALHFATVSTLAADLGNTCVFPALISGGCLHVFGYDVATDADSFAAYVSKRPIDVLKIVPSHLDALLAANEAVNILPLKYLILGGEAFSLDLMERVRALAGDCQVINHYGPTETTVGSLTFSLPRGRSAWTSSTVPIGRPIANTEVYLLDEHLKPVPIGVLGQIFIGGAGLSEGYLKQPEQTAARFIPNPFSTNGHTRLYQTGDLGRYLQDGSVEFLGRVDHQVKIRGYRIEMGEIESTLEQHPVIRECVVLAREDTPGDERLVAYVVRGSEQGVSAGELRGYLKERLPEYMIPGAYVELEQLPLTPNGKVDRRALPAPGERALASGDEFLGPRTPLEEVMCGIWMQVLRVERVSIRANFFELGGHSLLATQVIARVRQVCKVELALRALFEAPTVAGLSERVAAAQLRGQGVAVPELRRAAREGELPLSFAQQRLWFLEQLAPQQATYNMPMGVRIKGQLREAALAQAVSEIVRRHESLRTSFPELEGAAQQQIGAPGKVSLPLVDLSGLAGREQQAAVERLAREEAQRAFDLASGPLLRVWLLQLGRAEYVVLLTMHHIISDGWSMGVLVREVGALYAAYGGGELSPLAELGVQYADYAVWQREWLQGETLAAQVDYWREQLAGAPPVLELPTDRRRGEVRSQRGEQQAVVLSAELSQQLRELSRAQGVTLFMTLLAGWQLLLSRYARQEQVVVGTPIAGRRQLQTEELIGFFVNTLALRTELTGDPSIEELLRRVREVVLEAYAHQDVPFEKLVEELQPERSLSHTPLFQVMFVLQNLRREQLAVSGLELEMIGGGETAQAKFALTLGLEESESGIVGTLGYQRELFTAETVGRLAGHYQRVLAEMVRAPQQRVSELRLLSGAEEAELVIENNRTERDYRQEVCIHELFAEQVQRRPDAVAVVYEAEQLSYGALNERANQVAHYLRSLGVGPGSLVGILMARSLEMVVGLLGVLKAGAAYVPLDPDYPSQRLLFMMADAGVQVLLSQDRLKDVVDAAGATVVLLDSDWSLIEHSSAANPKVLLRSELPAYVIYTSGSTGVPKGVLVTHRSLLNLVDWHLREFDVSANDCATQLAGLAFDASVWELWPYLAAGATLHLPPDDTRISPEGLQEWLLSRGITISFLPTPMAERMLSLEWPSKVALRKVLTGGDKLNQYPNGRIPFQLVNNYGPTENTVVATSTLVPVEGGGDWSPAIGRPIDNVRTYLLDDNQQVVPGGVPGEIYIGGESLALGYLNRPELTGERFIPDPFSQQAGARLYRTGDLARYRANGEIEFLGRTDEQVKIRGFRIELNEIEAVLSTHPSVSEAILLAREDVPGDKQLVAYVVAKLEAPSFTSSELREHLGAELPQYMIPAAFVLLDALPLTPNGKIDRRALPAPERANLDKEKALVAPRNAIEEKLTIIWQETLGVEPISVDDNFFELGGHSLLAVRLMARVAQQCGQALPLATLFQGGTIERMALLLEGNRTLTRWSPLVALQPNGPRRPFFCVHPVGGHVLCYAPLTSHWEPERPFYALQARGLEEDQTPTAHIAEMASEYIEAMRSVQPTGPYLLGGWSVGGIIAFEMAQQLHAQKQEVALLALFDSKLPSEPKTPLDNLMQLRSFARDLGLEVDKGALSRDTLMQAGEGEQLALVMEKARQSLLLPPDLTDEDFDRLYRVFKTNLRALYDYVPQLYAGKVTLLSASEQPEETRRTRRLGSLLHRLNFFKREKPAPADSHWEKLAHGGVERYSVPGSHYTIVREPNVGTLAAHLQNCIHNLEEK